MPKAPINVLFIDDDSSLQLLATTMLNSRLFNVLGALNTKEADKMLKERKIELIICDVMMPDEDGISYCNRLKKAGSSIPFLILSAVGDPRVVARGFQAGADQYLVKPFDLVELQKQMLQMTGHKIVDPTGKKRHADADNPTFLSWFLR